MILFQTLGIRCLVVYNITFLLLVFFTFESALYVAVCSVKLSRSCGNRLFLQSLSSCLFFPSLVLISLEYHGAAGRTVTVWVENGVWKSNILRSSELYKSTLRICPQGQLSTMQLEFLSFSKRYVLAVRGEEQPLRRNKSKKNRTVALRTPVITLRILRVDPLDWYYLERYMKIRSHIDGAFFRKYDKLFPPNC